ncbi:hypothetical protein OHB49_45205 (plasmid) [Streptomyces sp. NBC_01717]|uniref:hypothetical protein n=1 Tax=Streptomyces sp. NBC_01717 TaxID=2975918 RepID=UPI002E34D120|nr:hypothetical protein [Streptomyces sp. NBC_01717]
MANRAAGRLHTITAGRLGSHRPRPRSHMNAGLAAVTVLLRGRVVWTDMVRGRTCDLTAAP